MTPQYKWVVCSSTPEELLKENGTLHDRRFLKPPRQKIRRSHYEQIEYYSVKKSVWFCFTYSKTTIKNERSERGCSCITFYEYFEESVTELKTQ